MAFDIVYIQFEEDFPRLYFQEKVYSPEEFPLRVPIADYDYFVDAGRVEEVKELVLFLDECFEKLKGGFYEDGRVL